MISKDIKNKSKNINENKIWSEFIYFRMIIYNHSKIYRLLTIYNLLSYKFKILIVC